MNKFKNLSSKLIKNQLWCSEIEYIVTEKVASSPGLPISYAPSTTISLKVIIKSVSKNLVDNVKVFSSDSSFVMDALTLVPKIQDYVIISSKKWKIVSINPLGILNNEPTAFELVIRQA